MPVVLERRLAALARHRADRRLHRDELAVARQHRVVLRGDRDGRRHARVARRARSLPARRRRRRATARARSRSTAATCSRCSRATATTATTRAAASCSADKPVQVIGGHSCANVPDPDTGACDHLEEAMFPTQILGKDYVVSYPGAVASESPHVLRILAVKQNTHVEFEPAIAEPIMLGPDSAPYELRIGSFSRGAAGDRGATARPARDSGQADPGRAVHAGADRGAERRGRPVDVARGADRAVPQRVHVHGLDHVRLELHQRDRQDRHRHHARRRAARGRRERRGRERLSRSSARGCRQVAAASITSAATQPFGLVVYGYGRFTSYMYPGGLDLRRITVPGPD